MLQVRIFEFDLLYIKIKYLLEILSWQDFIFLPSLKHTYVPTLSAVKFIICRTPFGNTRTFDFAWSFNIKEYPFVQYVFCKNSFEEHLRRVMLAGFTVTTSITNQGFDIIWQSRVNILSKASCPPPSRYHHFFVMLIYL